MTDQRAEIAAALVAWKRFETKRAQARLKVEAKSSTALLTVVRQHTSSAAERLDVLRGATRFSKSVALATIHTTSTQLQNAAAASIVQSRTDARSASAERTEAELAHLTEQLKRDGWDDQLPEASLDGDDSADYVSAASSAQSLAARWSAVALGAVLTWDSRDSGTSPSAGIRRATIIVEPSVDRIISVEISDAFHSEQTDALEPLSEYDWAPQMMRVWSGMLDGLICQRCYEMDGTTIQVGAEWPGGATQPMHAHCRCMDVPIYIPKPRRLADTVSDYAGYKAEIRDQIRESRHTAKRVAGRYAPGFIERSQPNRSPVVISKDFAVGRLRRAAGSK